MEANIPCAYWSLNMNDFKGPQTLLDAYNKYISNLTEMYSKGVSLCFAGSHGIGKTLCSTNILKKACHKNYSCIYTTLSDVVSVLVDAPNEEKFFARKILTMSDFIVIDEFDHRFFNANGADLFGRTLENIFRTRLQNKLPTIMCTNSPNPVEGFTGVLKQSIESLYNSVETVIAIGQDFRKQGK